MALLLLGPCWLFSLEALPVALCKQIIWKCIVFFPLWLSHTTSLVLSNSQDRLKYFRFFPAILNPSSFLNMGTGLGGQTVVMEKEKRTSEDTAGRQVH